MIKFYFGYNKFNGNIFPVKWMEDDGIAVGGKPTQVLQKVEISEFEFVSVGMSKLEMIYPFYPRDGETGVKV